MPVSSAGRGRASVGRWAPGGSPANQPGGLAQLDGNLGRHVGAPKAILGHRGMGRWCACAVDQNVPDHPRCPVFASCAAADRQTAPAATRRAIGSRQALSRRREDRLCGPPLLSVFFPLGCALAAQAPERVCNAGGGARVPLHVDGRVRSTLRSRDSPLAPRAGLPAKRGPGYDPGGKGDRSLGS